MSWHHRASSAARAAALLRAELGCGPSDAVCSIDLCVRRGLDVWFRAVPSMEGLYLPGDPSRVIISSLRPAGRRRYTAAHELGHDVHGHGASHDAQLNDESTEEEFIANRFARALLMPQLVVANAFSRRGWIPHNSTAAQAFVVAQDLGVGFTTLLDHMSQTLHVIDRAAADAMGRRPLPKLRAEIFRGHIEHDLFPVDQHWGVRPLDLEIGDVATAPPGSVFEGRCLEGDGGVLHARRAGAGLLSVPGRTGAITVRVSRREYFGHARYRHLEDPDAD